VNTRALLVRPLTRLIDIAELSESADYSSQFWAHANLNLKKISKQTRRDLKLKLESLKYFIKSKTETEIAFDIENKTKNPTVVMMYEDQEEERRQQNVENPHTILTLDKSQAIFSKNVSQKKYSEIMILRTVITNLISWISWLFKMGFVAFAANL